VIGCVLWAYATYAIDTIPTCGGCPVTSTLVTQHEAALKHEYFLRALTYPIHPDCFSENEAVCGFVDSRLDKYMSFDNYLIIVVSAVLAAAWNMFVTYRLTIYNVLTGEPAI
jgi:hypothetical protein